MSDDAARRAWRPRPPYRDLTLALLLLLGFLFSLVAPSTPAFAQPLSVTLSSPAGGEDWTGGSIHAIVWSVYDPGYNDTYWLNWSADNGSSWSSIIMGIVVANNATHVTSWSVPPVTSTQMRLSLCAADFFGTTCRTSAPFVVDSTPPVASPAPASGFIGLDPHVELYVNFSEGMKNQNLSPSTVTFVPAVQVTSVTWITPISILPVAPHELVIAHADFAPATTYFWYIDCSIVDESVPGNPVAGCGSPIWSFRTNTPPSVLSVAVDGVGADNVTLTVPSGWVPTFSWGFQDPDSGAGQTAYTWEIVYRDNGTYVSDSGIVYSSSISASYTGPTLTPGSCYSLRLRVYDGVAWSAPASLDFCVVLQATGGAPVSVLSWLALGFLPIVLLSVVVVIIRPRFYRFATVAAVIEALLALAIDLSLMVTSIAPFEFAPSPALVAAAVLIVLPVVVHFLPETSRAALDPSPAAKVALDVASVAAMAATVIVGPIALAPGLLSIAADTGLASSSATRLGRRRISPAVPSVGSAPPGAPPTWKGGPVAPPTGGREVPGPPSPPVPVGERPHPPEVGAPAQVGEGTGQPGWEIGVGHDEREELARPTFRAPPGRDRRARAPRYTNVCFTPAGSAEPLDRRLSLKSGQRYTLRIDIGPPSLASIVVHPEEHPIPEKFLPHRESGHWLQVAVLSTEFRVEPRLHPLFLPLQGPAWVCRCPPDRPHRCSADGRRKYLTVDVVAPDRRGLARLRISIYFENNLVQSQLLTAEIADAEREGSEQQSEVDYTLTAQLQDVGFLPPRSLNILTNRNSDGSHLIVFKNGTTDALALTIPEQTLHTAIEAARGALLDIHREVYGGQLGTQAQTENRYDENNSKDKAHFVADLRKLAEVGWGLWCSLFQPADHEAQRHLLEFIRESGKTIQVARVETTTFVFPWAAVYDIPLEGEADAWRLCRVLDGWDPQRGGAPDELPTTCPYENTHTENMVCPYGFWGMRHIIEEPPSSHNEALPVSISIHSPPQVVMSSSLDLDPVLTDRHLHALASLVPGLDLTRADSRDELRSRLGATVLGLVYFYCHGKREEQPGNAAPKPYLEIGHQEKVTPTDITTWRVGWTDPNHWSTTPLVFINGCHTTELSPELLVNFVGAFRGANAGGVIGTEISIDQRVANEVAERFLRHFVNQEPVGRGLLLVRLGLLRKGNLMGLAYTAYCSASLRFTYT